MKTSSSPILGFALGIALLSAHDVLAQARPLPAKIWGVTTDSVSGLAYIVTSLKDLAKMPMTRIVFDEGVNPPDYAKAVKQIQPVSYILGELLDSFAFKSYSTQQYIDRANSYFAAFADKVDLWEIGNEINGEWLGDTATVANKMTGAYDSAKARGLKTELTLYYNNECWERADHEMFTWTNANVPERMKQGLDYVLISYYEDDCNGYQPDWQKVFDQLGAMFPNSKIGFGECGTKNSAQKANYVNRYYKKTINHPRYVGGYFWWYFKQDMVPKTKLLWTTLNNAIATTP